MELRPYQIEANKHIQEEWENGNNKTLLVLPTGLGKTVTFSDLTKTLVSKGERVLIMAHRGELLDQAADKLFKVTGLKTAVEKADDTAENSFYRVTVGSVQTLMREKRLKRFKRDIGEMLVKCVVQGFGEKSLMAVGRLYDEGFVFWQTIDGGRCGGVDF